MKRPGIKIWAAILCAFLILCACSKQPRGSGAWTTDKNQRAQLSDYKGKVVLLDFYATWCEPCRVETPHLVRLQNEYGPKGLQVIGLNVGGDEDRDKVPAYAKEFSIQYPLAFPDDDLVTKYLSDNDNIPQSFVFDRNGNMVKRFIGYNPRSGAELDRIVKTTVESAPQ
ncbi:MAG: TlpA family protein disulfide reductase [Pyrinomonadaceae bacterium]